jgi:hypothetical protein
VRFYGNIHDQVRFMRRQIMSHNGLVSVIVGGTVRLKIIVRTKGENVALVAEEVQGLGRLPSREEAYSIAVRHDFGADYDRVVMDADDAMYHTVSGGLVDGPGPRILLHRSYRDTFRKPRSHPCVAGGECDYARVVEF